MTFIESLPLDLRCRCGYHLLGATVTVRAGGIESHELIVNKLNIICPACKGLLQRAEDDFTRAIAMMEKRIQDG